MAKTIRWKIEIILALILLSFSSCGDDFALSEKYYYIENENKEWLIADSLVGEPFDMVDANGITFNFTGYTVKNDFSIGTSGLIFLPMPTKKSYRENYYLTNNSNYGLSFSMYLYASYGVEFGDEIHINLGDIIFHYDLKNKLITKIYLPNGSENWTTTSNDKTKIFVNVDELKSLNINHKTYEGVIHFSMKDNINMLTERSITELYYAKQWGLIKYVYKNGLVVERK